MSNIGNVLDRLMTTVESRRGDDPETSYTASLLAKGPARCAKKFGEEAVEVALAGALQDAPELVNESADVLYHLAVLLAANGVSFADVAAALAAREGTSGHEEKAGRKTS
ncbi:MAG: phosphoribosyl-ATP diphosphatase [Pseudomonadota bacterium]